MPVPSLPIDILELIFVNLDLKTLLKAMAVCRHWHDVGRRDAVIVEASAITGSLTRTQLRGLLGLHAHEMDALPCRPFVTLRGRTCWLYGPAAVAKGLNIKQSLTPKKRLSRHTRGGRATTCEKSRIVRSGSTANQLPLPCQKD